MKNKQKKMKICSFLLTGAILCAFGAILLKAANENTLNFNVYAEQNDSGEVSDDHENDDDNTPLSLFTYEDCPGGIAVTGFTGDQGDITVPAQIDGKSVVCIRKEAFENCQTLRSIKLSDGIETIESGAFSFCSSLTEVVLPEGLEEISDWLFAYDPALETVRIPDSIKRIGCNAFRSCPLLSGIILPEGLTEFGEYAFVNCRSLESIEIPAGIRIIPQRAFSGCGFKNVTLNEGLEEIDSYAFDRCSELHSITLPSTVKHLRSRAFYSIYQYAGVPLKELIVLGGDTEFDDRAAGFYYSNGVEKKSNDLVIISSPDSKAQEYAENGFEFHVFESERVYPADIRLLYQRTDPAEAKHSFRLIPILTPDNVTEKKIKWSSSDESIAVVDKGIVRPVITHGKYGTGIAVITAETENGLSVQMRFGAEYSNGINSFYAVGEPVIMMIDTEVYLSSAMVFTGTIIWESDNENVAVVRNDGKITAVGAGQATITAKNEDGIITKIDITVEDKNISETSEEKQDVSESKTNIPVEESEISYYKDDISDTETNISEDMPEMSKETSANAESHTPEKVSSDDAKSRTQTTETEKSDINDNAYEKAPSTGGTENTLFFLLTMAVSFIMSCICVRYAKSKHKKGV